MEELDLLTNPADDLLVSLTDAPDDDSAEEEENTSAAYTNPAFTTTAPPRVPTFAAPEDDEEGGEDDEYTSVTRKDLQEFAKKQKADIRSVMNENIAVANFQTNAEYVKAKLDTSLTNLNLRLTPQADQQLKEALATADPLRLMEVATNPANLKQFMSNIIFDDENPNVEPRGASVARPSKVDPAGVVTSPVADRRNPTPPLSSIDPQCLESIRRFAAQEARATGKPVTEVFNSRLARMHEQGTLELRGKKS